MVNKEVQGGLEILVKVIIEMEHSTRRREILARYQTHIIDNYKEPTDGKFDDGDFEELSGRGQFDSESDAVEDN